MRSIILILATILLFPSYSFAECSMDGNQTDMNACAREKYDEKKNEFDAFYQKVLKEAMANKIPNLMPTEIDKSQKAWLEYANQHCSLLKAYGGSSASMRYYKCLTEKYEQRIKEINFYICHPSLSECQL